MRCGPWFSHPATFVVAGVGSSFLFVSLWQRRHLPAIASCSVVAVWAVSLAANYAIFLRPLAKDQGLLNYWADDFAPIPPRSAAQVSWYVETLFRSVKEVYGNPATMQRLGEVLSGLGVVVGFGGFLSLAKKDRRAFILLLAPIGFTLVASALHKYPFRGRLVLFLDPIYIILLAAGADALHRSLPRDRRAFNCLAIVLLFGSPWVMAMASLLRTPPSFQEMKPLLGSIQAQFAPGETFYLHNNAEPAFLFYTRYIPGYELPAGAVIAAGGSAGLRDKLQQMKGRGRVWVIAVHFRRPEELEDEPLRCALDSMGQRIKEVHFNGISSYLYNL